MQEKLVFTRLVVAAAIVDTLDGLDLASQDRRSEAPRSWKLAAKPSHACAARQEEK
jgi:hypothetical protein